MSARPKQGSRLDLLLTRIQSDGGEWATRRVQQVYGPAAPFRATARKDLSSLAAMGWLIHDTTNPDRHVYRLNHATAVTS